jgi:predicted Fe-Mo cluster-binding NifX family protein
MFKVAVPSRGDLVDEHFGHCEAFTIFTIDDGKNIVEQIRLTPPPACGCKSNLVTTLVDMGVSVMIAGGMGEGAVCVLGEQGIKTVRGASGPVRQALMDWLDGQLSDSEEVCHAHGSGECGSH